MVKLKVIDGGGEPSPDQKRSPILTRNRQCGPCTVCCTAMRVFELNKDVFVRCEHVKRKMGCKIYPDRPMGCRKFKCLWLSGSIQDSRARPDKLGVMFAGATLKADPSVLAVHLYESKRGAINRPLVKEIMAALCEKAKAIAVQATRDGELVLLGGHPEALEKARKVGNVTSS